MECKLKEQVWLTKKGGKSYAGVVTNILRRSPNKKAKADKENAAVRSINFIQFYSIFHVHVQDILYDIELTDGKEVEGVPRSAIVRSIPTPSRDLMKTFIRAHSRRFKEEPGMPWIVDEPFKSIHNVRLLSYSCICFLTEISS